MRATKVKTYGGMEDSATSYFVENGVMVGECTVRNGSAITSKILYQFDENGQRTGFTHNGTQYYYLYNLQGDVVAVLDSNASIVAKYTYDAWGKVLSVTNASGTVQTSASFIGNINPIRYRGYYYDVETGLYYLQSRYYDPETGRFVNADNIVPKLSETMQDYNLYAYCADDPVNNEDPTGHDGTTVYEVETWVIEFAKNGYCGGSYQQLVKKAFESNGIPYGRGYSMVGDAQGLLVDWTYKRIHPETKQSATSIKADGMARVNYEITRTITQAIGSTIKSIQSIFHTGMGPKLHYFSIDTPEGYDGGPVVIPEPDGDNPYTNQAYSRSESYVVIFYA